MSIEIEKDPLNPDLRYQRALKLYDKGLYNECIEDMRMAITYDSLKPEYYHLVSDAFLDANYSSRALQSMEKAAALFPNRIPTLLKLSEMQLILAQYDAAIGTCNNIVKQDGQNAEAYFMLGTILNQKGEKQRAINAFQTATEMDSKLIDAWIALGNLFAEKNDKAAETFYKNALTIDPKNSDAKQAYAYYLQNSGDDAKALELYSEIIQDDPGYTNAYLNSGILYYEQKKLDNAYELFNLMIGINPKDWAGYHYRGLINYERKNYKDAQADFQSSVNLNGEKNPSVEFLEKCKTLNNENP
jgi:tetratricopeptide (TPR) repeat protein